MPSTYSSDLRIELIANGEQSGTWGTTTNNNLGYLIEDAISGAASVSVTSANQALTALNGAVDQARCAAIVLTTTTSAPFNVFVPPVTKLYVFKNNSGYGATVYCSTVLGNTTAAGTGVAIPDGQSVLLRSDGTNIVDQINYVSGSFGVGGNATVTGNLAVTGNAAFTAIPTAPTATTGDNSTKLATTAFVQTAATGAAGNALQAPAATGIVVCTDTSTKATTGRSITSGTGVTVGNGDGISGNPTISISNDGVTTTQLANNAVSNAKILDGAVTASKLNGAQSGAAPVYGIRAWVTFDGTNGNILSSGNVSSVTKNTTGDWTISFSTALPTSTYALSGTARPNVNNTQAVSIVVKYGTTPSTSSVTIRAINDDASSANPTFVSVMVIC